MEKRIPNGILTTTLESLEGIKKMTEIEARAEVFYMAFKSMPQSEQDAVLSKFAEDEELLDDLQDMIIAQQRRDEPSRSFDDFLSEKNA